MSGGYFNYDNLQMGYIADKYRKYLTWNLVRHSPEVREKLLECLHTLEKADICMRKVDYLLSGDYSDESFIRNLEEGLNKLKTKNDPEIKEPTCKDCGNYKGNCGLVGNGCKFDYDFYPNRTLECWSFFPKQEDDE